jgi:acyl-coenzyme A thioesterase PaaI-like protein
VIDPETAALVADIRNEYSGCFACGTTNPVGLHLDPADLDGNEAVAHYRPSDNHAGAGETLHGGLAATVLDEIMVWAGILSHRVLAVTGTMDLRYRHPVSVGDEITVRGRVDERSGRRLQCSGRLEIGGVTAVTARGLYLVSRTFVRSSETS